MNRVLLVLVLVCCAQSAFAQEMDVWQAKGGAAQSANSVNSGGARRAGGGNEFDSRVQSVSGALGRTSANKAPRVTTSTWLRSAINGQSDSTGDRVVVVRGRYTELVDNRNPNKPKTKRMAEAYQGGAMGYTVLSPDGMVALLADDAQKFQVVGLDTGRVFAEGDGVTGSRFVGQSTIYWWSEQGPSGRKWKREREVKRDATKNGLHDLLFFAQEASMDYFPCELTRLDWSGGGGAQTVTFSECDSILSVSKDGTSALLGNQGEVRSMSFSGNQTERDIYGEIVRVDLETMERTVVGQGRFMDVAMSDDLSVICSSDPDNFYGAGDAIVTCYRDGQRIEHRFTAPARRDISWRSVAVSPDGKYFAIRLHVGKRTPLGMTEGLTYVQELGAGGEPLLTISGVGSMTWLAGDRRLVFITNNGPAMLYDYKSGWRAKIGGAKDEHSGLIVLGERDDQFLIGRERGSTRDMWLVTVGSDVKR